MKTVKTIIPNHNTNLYAMADEANTELDGEMTVESLSNYRLKPVIAFEMTTSVDEIGCVGYMLIPITIEGYRENHCQDSIIYDRSTLVYTAIGGTDGHGLESLADYINRDLKSSKAKATK